MKISYEIVEKMEIFTVLKPKLKTITKYIDAVFEQDRKISLNSFADKEDFGFCIDKLNKECDKLNLICVFDELNRVYEFRPKNIYANNSNYEPIHRYMNKVFRESYL
jgi:hypothetical protein